MNQEDLIFLFIFAKDCSGCINFKRNFKDELISNLKKEFPNILLKELEFESRGDKTPIGSNNTKILSLVNFWPSFAICSKQSFLSNEDLYGPKFGILDKENGVEMDPELNNIFNLQGFFKWFKTKTNEIVINSKENKYISLKNFDSIKKLIENFYIKDNSIDDIIFKYSFMLEEDFTKIDSLQAKNKKIVIKKKDITDKKNIKCKKGTNIIPIKGTRFKILKTNM